MKKKCFARFLFFFPEQQHAKLSHEHVFKIAAFGALITQINRFRSTATISVEWILQDCNSIEFVNVFTTTNVAYMSPMARPFRMHVRVEP